MNFEYEVKAISSIGRAKKFVLFPLKEKVNFKPGQFVKLSNKQGLGRPYSICSPPEWQHIEFLINVNVGEFTNYLGKIEVGEILNLSRAAGHMVYNKEEKAVFITGGTGIAPMMSIIRHIALNKFEGEFYLFYSARTLNDMAFYEELLSYSGIGIINFVPTLTREKLAGFYNERISIDMIEKHIKNLEEFTYFMCGKNQFVFSIRDKLIENGVDKSSIKVEGWG